MENLARLLRNRMDSEHLSVRQAGKQIGISHSTVARVVNGETVEVDTLIKICDFLGIPVESVLNLQGENDELMKQIMTILSIEPELAEVFKQIAEDMAAGKLEPVILSEIAAFSHYRLEYKRKRSDPKSN